MVFRKAELPDSSTAHHELSDEKDPLHVNEADSTEPQIYEMPGDIPKPQEAGGRQLSEKESMVVRERIYNGIDPTSPTGVAPTAQAPPRQLAPITASEVTIVSPEGSTNNTTVSPVSPRTPSARDGLSWKLMTHFSNFRHIGQPMEVDRPTKPYFRLSLPLKDPAIVSGGDFLTNHEFCKSSSCILGHVWGAFGSAA